MDKWQLAEHGGRKRLLDLALPALWLLLALLGAVLFFWLRFP